MSVRKAIADELRSVADELKSQEHHLAGVVERIWTKLTVGLPPAEHQALEDAHALAADAQHAAAPVVAEAAHHAGAIAAVGMKTVDAAIGDTAAGVDAKAVAALAAEQAATGHGA